MSLGINSGGVHALCTTRQQESAPILLCLHGFGDHGGMFAPLFETKLAGPFRIVAPDLPGCGLSPPDPVACTIDSLATRVEQLIDQMDDSATVALVGHSLASAVAVAMAEHLAERCLGVFSIEGNLTAKDAYFSGQAAKWDDADKFKAHLVKGARNMAHFKPELARYADALEMANAATLWRLGKDAHHCGDGDGLGQRYRALECPTLYYWSSKTTPAVTREYLLEHDIPALEYADAGHWPTLDAPEMCAEAIAGFFKPLGD